MKLMRVMSLIQVLVNRFLRYFLVPVIQVTLFLIIQFLVNYHISPKNVILIVLQESVKKEMTISSQVTVPVMKRQRIQIFSVVFWSN